MLSERINFMSNYSYNIIDNVINSTSSEKLCDSLKQCQGVLKTRFTNKTSFMERLQKEIREQVLSYKYNVPVVKVLEQPMSNIFVYEDKVSYLVFSSFKINLCSSIEELNSQIADIIDFFENKMTKSRTDILNIDEIIGMFNIVQRKYNLMDIISCDKEFEIFLMNRSHICYDSFLLTFRNINNGLLLKRWMLFSLSPCVDILASNKYFVFLHEIGHCFYNVITLEDGNALKLFDEIAVTVGLPAFNEEGKSSELFADIFAATALSNTNYAYYNPFKNVFPEKGLELFELYFKILVSQVNIEHHDFKKEKVMLH